MPLINCEIEIDLLWSKKCIISEISITTATAGNPRAKQPVPVVAARKKTRTTFQINNGKLYVPTLTLSINDNMKVLENIKRGFKRTISWNKYRSEITIEHKNNNLDYVLHPTFRSINRLFVLSCKNGNDDNTRDYCDKYFVSLVEIKDFTALIDNKSCFDQPVKNKLEAYEKLIEMSRNHVYTVIQQDIY